MTTSPGLPLDFCEEAQRAFERQDRAHLLLQSMETDDLSWGEHAKAFLDDLLEELSAGQCAERVVLFTGHRIDAADRKNPRFPAEAEDPVRLAIDSAVRHQKASGETTALAGGANGGDILFLEACRHTGLPFQMLLSLPRDEFVRSSVATDSGNWVARFDALQMESPPHVLAQTEELPGWLKDKPDYSFWARNNLWLICSALALAPKHFTLLALWDGATGDGPGGTEHMVKTAQQHGAELVWLDIRQLTIHSARQ